MGQRTEGSGLTRGRELWLQATQRVVVVGGVISRCGWGGVGESWDQGLRGFRMQGPDSWSLG